MKKPASDTKLETMGGNIYSLGFSIDILCYIIDTFEPLEYLHDNSQFMQIDNIYRSLLSEIATLIESLPDSLVSDASTALNPLPTSLFKLWEIDDRWQQIKSLLLSASSQATSFSNTKRLKIDENLWEEKSKILDTTEELVKEYFSAIEGNASDHNASSGQIVGKPLYTLRYDHMSGHIYVNDLLIQRTQVDGSSDIIMSRVIDTPNTLISFNDSPRVNVSSFINNSRIPNELCRLFFPRRAKKSLQLVPVITAEMAKKNNLDIASLNQQLENIAYPE